MPLGKVTELKLECLPESEHTPPTASNGQDAQPLQDVLLSASPLYHAFTTLGMAWSNIIQRLLCKELQGSGSLIAFVPKHKE